VTGAGTSSRCALAIRIARLVTARHDLDDVLSEAFRALRPELGCLQGSIQLLDDEGWIRIAAAHPSPAEPAMTQRVPLGSSVAGRVVLTEQSVYLSDLQAGAQRVQRLNPIANDCRSYFAVPLVADGAAVGLIAIESAQSDAWSADQRDCFESIAPIIGAAIQNARSHARVTAARASAASAARRLQESRQLVAAARAALRRGDSFDAEKLLHRIEQVLDEAAEPAATTTIVVPAQRTSVS
jgi:transcriptional regulator with GAF, ATPase, and Fis domain